MSVWGRRCMVFGLVLGTGVACAQVARRPTALAVSAGAGAGAAGADPGRGDARAPVPPASGSHGGTAPPPQMGSSAPRKESGSGVSALSGPGGAKALISGAGGVRTYHDRSYKVSFDYPANWQFTDKDHEISTFRLDARTADRKTQLRAVTALAENPYPASTFTGAFVYLSVTPHSNQEKCAAQASTHAARRRDTSEIAGLSFVHGHEEQKTICTVERDEIYTTYRKGACYRFDLAMNNFCGGEVSGVKDVTEQELDTVRTRLESIIGTVRFDGK